MDWDEYFMRHVYLAASKSKDPRTKIGAVLVKNGIIISEGFNGFARKVHDLPQRYNDRDIKYQFTVHGEANSILNAVRHGISSLGSTLYTQAIPCHECAKAIIQAGVERVFIHTQWPDMTGKWPESMKITKIMFEEADIPVNSFAGKLGIQGFLNGDWIDV